MVSIKELSEEDIKIKYITPAIQKSNWDIQTQVRCEYYYTAGKMNVRENVATRGKRKFVDYLLSYKSNLPIAIIEAKDNVNLTVIRNVKQGAGSYTYDYMVEALNNVIKLTGIDLKQMFEERINDDMKKLDPQAQEIKEQLEANKEAQYDIRKKKIAMLAEKFKNDPVRIALLNKVAKDLAILEKKN